MIYGASHQELCNLAEMFGDARRPQGDVFERNTTMPAGMYYYVTGGVLTSVQVWGSEDKPSLSVYSCARAGMHPQLELYRYISLWRTTSGYSAPYVVELKGKAAVMCEREIHGVNFNNDSVLARHVAVTIDLVAEASKIMSVDLSRADGFRLEQRGAGHEFTHFQLWLHWQVSDPRISKISGLS